MTVAELEPVERLSRDLRKAAVTLSRDEARFLVDSYYQMQENRKRAANQVRSMEASGEPHAVLTWLLEQSASLERSVGRALDAYSAAAPLGEWARQNKGIGPVIAAGLLAHIDVERAPTAGAVWRFAGLDPTSEWKKGEKRPWNAALKVLCWKIGESFVKVSGLEGAHYGRLYLERKAYEQEINEAGGYADQAAERLGKVGKQTEAHKWYAQGKLPPGHIHARAKRWAVKLFLSHYHQRGREMAGLPVVAPFPVQHMGHSKVIGPFV